MFPIYSKLIRPTGKFAKGPDPVVIEGVESYDVLCPVNKLTGCRENPLELLRTLSNDPKRQRLLDGILVELPTIASDSRLSDDDKIDMLMCRLSTGCPAEDDLYREKLEVIAEPLFKSFGASSKEVKRDVDNTVQINKDDAAIIDNA